MKTPILTMGFVLFTAAGASAQFDPNYKPKTERPSQVDASNWRTAELSRRGNVGLGLGLDYGSIGARGCGFVSEHVGLFLGMGIAHSKFAMNAGTLYRFRPRSPIVPTLLAMFGYNAWINVIGMEQYNKLYYGPSLGAGFAWHLEKVPSNFFNFEFIVPFQSAAFTRDYDALMNNSSINSAPPVHSWGGGLVRQNGDLSASLPFSISIGYHFGLGSSTGAGGH